MIEHGKVQSTIRPNAIDIDEYSVWVAENITETTTENDMLYEYDLVQYTKDEYILQIAARDDVKSKAIMELSDMVATLMEG
jgi:hypothetical protein